MQVFSYKASHIISAMTALFKIHKHMIFLSKNHNNNIIIFFRRNAYLVFPFKVQSFYIIGPLQMYMLSK